MGIVDAPRSFYMLWRAAAPLLSEKTKSKVRFVSRGEAVALVKASSGPEAAAAVDRTMALNRTPEGFRGNKFPSELDDNDGEEQNAPAAYVRRAVTRRLIRAVSDVHEAYHQTWTWSRFRCCRRRSAHQSTSVSKSAPRTDAPVSKNGAALTRRRVILSFL